MRSKATLFVKLYAYFLFRYECAAKSLKTQENYINIKESENEQRDGQNHQQRVGCGGGARGATVRRHRFGRFR